MTSTPRKTLTPTPDRTAYMILSANDQGQDININPPTIVTGWNATVEKASLTMQELLAEVNLEDQEEDALECVVSSVPDQPGPFTATYANDGGPFTVTVQEAPPVYVLSVTTSDDDLATLSSETPVVSANPGALKVHAREAFIQAAAAVSDSTDDEGLSADDRFDADAGTGPTLEVAFVSDSVTVRATVTVAEQV